LGWTSKRRDDGERRNNDNERERERRGQQCMREIQRIGHQHNCEREREITVDMSERGRASEWVITWRKNYFLRKI